MRSFLKVGILSLSLILSTSSCLTSKMLQMNINAANNMAKRTDAIYQQVVDLENLDLAKCKSDSTCANICKEKFQLPLNSLYLLKDAVQSWQSAIVEYQSDKSHLTMKDVSDMAGDAVIVLEDIAKIVVQFGVSIPMPQDLDTLCIIIGLETNKTTKMCETSLPITDAGAQ